MGKTFRNTVPFGDLRGSKRPTRRVNTCLVDTEQRGNRRAVAVALATNNWDRAMDIGTPMPQAGTYR